MAGPIQICCTKWFGKSLLQGDGNTIGVIQINEGLLNFTIFIKLPLQPIRLFISGGVNMLLSFPSCSKNRLSNTADS